MAILISIEEQECESWNGFCKKAWEQNNGNFRCEDSVIYYYEPDKLGWDEARQVCSLKFDGSYLADLVQVTDKKKLEKILGDLKIPPGK